MINNTDDIFFTSFFIFFFLTAISWITFAQFTMRPLEKKFKADGIPKKFLWDGIGALSHSMPSQLLFRKKLRFALIA